MQCKLRKLRNISTTCKRVSSVRGGLGNAIMTILLEMAEPLKALKISGVDNSSVLDRLVLLEIARE